VFIEHIWHRENFRKCLRNYASRQSRKCAWENLQEIRWVIKDTTGVDLPPPERKTIDLEGRIVKDGVRRWYGITAKSWPIWSTRSLNTANWQRERH
jgi:hypothetical protein